MNAKIIKVGQRTIAAQNFVPIQLWANLSGVKGCWFNAESVNQGYVDQYLALNYIINFQSNIRLKIDIVSKWELHCLTVM